MRLEIKDLHVHYGKIEAIKGISVVVNQGEIVTLIGANGAGKTTTLKTVSGLRKVSSGAILFDGQDISKVPAHERVDLHSSHVDDSCDETFPFQDSLKQSFQEKFRDPPELERCQDLLSHALEL